MHINQHNYLHKAITPVDWVKILYLAWAAVDKFYCSLFRGLLAAYSMRLKHRQTPVVHGRWHKTELHYFFHGHSHPSIPHITFIKMVYSLS